MFARNFQVKLNQNEFNQKAKNSMTSEFVKDKLLNSFFFSKIFVKTYQFLFSHTIDWGPSPSFSSNIGKFKRNIMGTLDPIWTLYNGNIGR